MQHQGSLPVAITIVQQLRCLYSEVLDAKARGIAGYHLSRTEDRAGRLTVEARECGLFDSRIGLRVAIDAGSDRYEIRKLAIAEIERIPGSHPFESRARFVFVAAAQWLQEQRMIDGNAIGTKAINRILDVCRTLADLIENDQERTLGQLWLPTINCGDIDVSTLGPAKDLPILSPKASAVYELLLAQPGHRGMTGPEIIEVLPPDLSMDESTLRKSVVPALEPYGLEHVPKIGYRIKPSRRPPRKDSV